MKKQISVMLAVAVFASAFLAGGCSKKNESKNEDVTVTWYLPIGNRNDDVAVYQNASDYVFSKLGVHLSIMNINSGSYEQKMQVMNASGDEYDICFTSNWLNNYYTAVQNELLMPLDNLLKEDAPNLYGLFNEQIWNGVKCNGKIYGVMNQQIFARSPALVIPKKNLNALGFTMDNFHSLADLTPYLKAVHQATQTRTVGLTDWQSYVQFAGMEELLGSGMPGAIYYNNQELKVVDQFETKEFQDFIKLVHSWVKDGLQHEEIVLDWDGITATKDKPVTEFAFRTPPTYKPGYVENLSTTCEMEMVLKPLAQPLLTSYGVTATMQSISANSKHEKEAIKVLELVNTDSHLFNLLAHGIEGKNYTKISENRISNNPDNLYNPSDWAIGNTFIGYELDSDPEKIYESTKTINETAKISPAYGFYPNMENFAVQTANCKAVIGEYLQGLEQGVVDTDTIYPQFIAKLKAAGVDELMGELQKQLDDWVHSK